ncbi:MAG: hypothetical protein LBK64_06830 [Spirochaetaceae bacterium]|nr:hypothetical protein [Spirochaetaceae bacterium]
MSKENKEKTVKSSGGGKKPAAGMVKTGRKTPGAAKPAGKATGRGAAKPTSARSAPKKPRAGAAKPTSAKSAPKKPKAGAGNSRLAALAKELAALIPRLDEEGLLFLIEQAQVHLYNMQVDELNQTMLRNAERAERGPKAKKPKGSGQADLGIQVSADKHSYYIVYRGKWVMFTDEEIMQLVKIASAPVDGYEKSIALYRWFERERRDVFGTIPIEGKTDPLLTRLAEVIRKNFKVKYK